MEGKVILQVIAVILVLQAVAVKCASSGEFDKDPTLTTEPSSAQDLEFSNFQSLSDYDFTVIMEIPLDSSKLPKISCDMSTNFDNYLPNPCPDFVQTMIKLDYQRLAKWTHSSIKKTHSGMPQYQFVFITMSYSNQSIEMCHIIFAIQFSSMEKEEIQIPIEMNKMHLFNSSECNYTQSSGSALNLTCAGEKKGTFAAVLKQLVGVGFNESAAVLGVEEMNGLGGVNCLPEGPGAFMVTSSDLTLKESWTLGDLKSNLVTFEEQRVNMCNCIKTLGTNCEDKKDSDELACLKFVNVREDFKPFLKSPSCFPMEIGDAKPTLYDPSKKDSSEGADWKSFNL